MTPRYVEVRAVVDEDIRARLEASIATSVAHDRNPGPVRVPLRDPRRLLCGCLDPEIGPSVVRDDGSCCACSR